MEKTLSSRVVFSGHAIRVRVDDVSLPSGRKSTREIVEHSDAVAIVALDDRNKVILVSQFRHAAGKELLEIPAGGIDPEESAEEAVRREMQEETGYLPHTVERLGGFYSAPGYATEYLYLYLATDLVPSQLSAEDTEEIKLVRAPLSQVGKLIADGSIQDAKSIAGLLFYLNQKT